MPSSLLHNTIFYSVISNILFFVSAVSILFFFIYFITIFFFIFKFIKRTFFSSAVNVVAKRERLWAAVLPHVRVTTTSCVLVPATVSSSVIRESTVTNTVTS